MEASPAVRKMAIIFPKVPVYVVGPVASLYQAWADIADAYERQPNSLRNAWLYLGHHPAFWTISERVGGFHVASGAAWYQFIELGVDEDNTVWIEIQPSRWPDDPDDEADHHIEISAPTYELAVSVAAAAVHNNYRNDREFLTKPLTDKWY